MSKVQNFIEWEIWMSQCSYSLFRVWIKNIISVWSQVKGTCFHTWINIVFHWWFFLFKREGFGVFYLHTWKENWKNLQILYHVLVTVFSCGKILCHGNKIKSSTLGSKDFFGKRAPKLQYFEEKKLEVIIFIQYIPVAC